jgi:hypothetical protein
MANADPDFRKGFMIEAIGLNYPFLSQAELTRLLPQIAA